jgi:uncharacterized protein YqgC (DUF456 family)
MLAVSAVEVLVALAILLGVLGVVVPVLPGGLLVAAAVLVWAFDLGGATAWSVFAACTVLLVAGAVVKYVVPGRRLQDAGVPSWTLVVGGLVGLVGFFVVPVVGLVLGFVLGVYLCELARLGRDAAWPATKQALLAAGLSMLIELSATLLAAATWVVGVVAT